MTGYDRVTLILAQCHAVQVKSRVQAKQAHALNLRIKPTIVQLT